MMSTQSFLKPLVMVGLLAAAGIAQAAVELDLRIVGATGDINGGQYTQMPLQPTGTGYIDPFVRVGMQGSAGEKVVHAYNTTADGVLNNSNEDNWNHEVKFGQFEIQTIGGKDKVRFLLDINQNSGGTGEWLSLDDVQIFISSVPNQSTTNHVGAVLDLASSTLVYRMDDAGTSSWPEPVCNKSGNNCVPPSSDDPATNRVVLDYSLNSGSGSGDMYLDIPVAMFETAFAGSGLTGKLEDAYIYLYSKFGSDPYNNNDGFEEWAFLAKVAPDDGGGGGGGVPEPSTLLLAGLGILAARKASQKALRKA